MGRIKKEVFKVLSCIFVERQEEIINNPMAFSLFNYT